MSAHQRVFVALALAALSFVAAACSTNDELIVFAPASLDGHLPALGTETVSYAGSNALVAQILDGAPAGVLITANESVAAPVIESLAPEVLPLVSNRLAVVVPPSNPGRVDELADLADPALRIAVCAPEVPCGQATQALVPDASADTFEPNVRAVLTRVELGEVDAGVVYETELAGADVVTIDVLDDQPTGTYLVLRLDDEPSSQDYFDWITSDGRDALLGAGFARP